jgi:flavin-dependent dehydrogenase
VARAVSPAVEETIPACRGIYYWYVREFGPPVGSTFDGAEFSRIENEIAYVFPSDDGVTCVALSVGLDDYASIRRDAERGFHNHIDRHTNIADRFHRSTMEGRLLGCGPEPSWVRVPVGPGWALVGDAGLHQDPWSGRGIDMATRHATFLAHALTSWWQGAQTEQDALRAFHEQRNQHALDEYHFTVTLARDLRQMDALSS